MDWLRIDKRSEDRDEVAMGFIGLSKVEGKVKTLSHHSCRFAGDQQEVVSVEKRYEEYSR